MASSHDAVLMPSENPRPSRTLSPRVPIVVLVLAFTAIPIEWSPASANAWTEFIGLKVDVLDIVANVLGYVPIGVLFSGRRKWQTLVIALCISMCAEATQMVTPGRSPSLIDVATNIVGAGIGLVASDRWRVVLATISISRRVAYTAAVLAVGYLAIGTRITPVRVEDAITMMMVAPPWLSVNDRGLTNPGRLEAAWSFDRVTNDLVIDESGNGLNGILINRPALVPGVIGRALALNGRNQWVDIGDPPALRLTGSMTVMAWVNAGAFPSDDGAIVSDYNGFGYQLDTTTDAGPRTIGFKLANAKGQLMARYGRTPLIGRHWYHVVGVYDAEARTLSVYLNGRRDDGCLVGSVTARQQISRKTAFIGRNNQRGFQFGATIDQVKIYSRALTGPEISAEVESVMEKSTLRLFEGDHVGDHQFDSAPSSCPSKEPTDARVAGFVVAFGLLIGVSCCGLCPRAKFPMVSLTLGLLGGMALSHALSDVVPTYFLYVVPALSVAGAASVIVSVDN